jgi:hypothetical protein
MLSHALPLLALLAALLLAGCGENANDPNPRGTGGNNEVAGPVEEPVRVGGIAYDVTLARKLNPAVAPDRRIYAGPRPKRQGVGAYAVFLRACNRSDEPRRTVSSFRIEDTFGQDFRPVGLARDNPYRFPRDTVLAPGRCTPAKGSVPARTSDGHALVFLLPVQALRDRPLSLVVGRQPPRQVELDL